jgi:hypothetical protein
MTDYRFGPYMVTHEDGITFAAIPPAGKFMSPAHVTTELSKAARFETWGAASDASQNFGADWTVEEV